VNPAKKIDRVTRESLVGKEVKGCSKNLHKAGGRNQYERGTPEGKDLKKEPMEYFIGICTGGELKKAIGRKEGGTGTSRLGGPQTPLFHDKSARVSATCGRKKGDDRTQNHASQHKKREGVKNFGDRQGITNNVLPAG